MENDVNCDVIYGWCKRNIDKDIVKINDVEYRCNIRHVAYDNASWFIIKFFQFRDIGISLTHKHKDNTLELEYHVTDCYDSGSEWMKIELEQLNTLQELMKLISNE